MLLMCLLLRRVGLARSDVPSLEDVCRKGDMQRVILMFIKHLYCMFVSMLHDVPTEKCGLRQAKDDRT